MTTFIPILSTHVSIRWLNNGKGSKKKSKEKPTKICQRIYWIVTDFTNLENDREQCIEFENL